MTVIFHMAAHKRNRANDVICGDAGDNAVNPVPVPTTRSSALGSHPPVQHPSRYL